MRDDFIKEVSSRGRPQRRRYPTRVPFKNTALEDMPKTESMSKKRHHHRAYNIRARLLKRWLHSQVGRRWSDVYSELCSQINDTKASELQVLEAVDWYIETKVRHVSTDESSTGLITAGDTITSRWSGRPWPVSENELYVDPDDGIIKIAKRLVPREPKPVPENKFKVVNNDRIAIKEEGLWYTIDLIEYKPAQLWQWHYNIDPSDRHEKNHGDDKYGYWREAVTVNGTTIPRPYSWATSPLEYIDVSVYIPYAWRGWGRNSQENSLIRQFGRMVLGRNRKSMDKKTLRSLNLKNDR